MLHPYKFGGGKEAGIIIPVPVKGFEPPTSLRSLAGSLPDRCLPLGHRLLRAAISRVFDSENSTVKSHSLYELSLIIIMIF